jgi:peptide deformylase
MLSILKDSNPKLREISKYVMDLTEVEALANQMFETLKAYPNGVALAAIQVGVPVRMFIIRKGLAAKHKIHHTIVNPIWKPLSQLKQVNEGCLSFEGVTENKMRYLAIAVTYTTTTGKEVKKTITDPLIAQIFQHEIEHFDGILLTDKG